MLREAARLLGTGEGKWAVALKCLIRLGYIYLVQRLTVYTVATVNCHLPLALDNQPVYIPEKPGCTKC